MKYVVGSFSAFALAVVAHAGDLSSTPSVAPPVDKRGAVLCQWSITITSKAIGEACFPGRDKDYLAALGWAIAQMDTFILRNSKTTKTQLQSNKGKIEEEARKNILFDQSGRCVPGQSAFIFYPEAAPTFDRKRLEIEVKALLAVDRPPVMNPCL